MRSSLVPRPSALPASASPGPIPAGVFSTQQQQLIGKLLQNGKAQTGDHTVSFADIGAPPIVTDLIKTLRGRVTQAFLKDSSLKISYKVKKRAAFVYGNCRLIHLTTFA
jgi:hypothetical protein